MTSIWTGLLIIGFLVGCSSGGESSNEPATGAAQIDESASGSSTGSDDNGKPQVASESAEYTVPTECTFTKLPECMATSAASSEEQS